MFEEMRSRFVIIVIAGICIVAVSIVLQATGNALFNSVAMLLAFYIALLAFSVYDFKRRGVKLRRVLFLGGSARWLLPVLGLTVLGLAFSMSIYWLLLRILLPISPAAAEIAFAQQTNPDVIWYLAAVGFTIAVIAPIAEEFLFRGVILHRLMNLLGFWNGILLTSLIFGIFHINFPGAFVFAVVAALLYIRTGNLLAPIVLHIANNAVSVHQSFADPSFPEWLAVVETGDLYAKSAPNLIVLLISSALLLFIVWRMSRDAKRKWTDATKSGNAETRR